MDTIITDPKILHQVSRDTTWKEVYKLNLNARMKEVIKTSWAPGLGLAAIQIGIPIRYIWYRFQKEKSTELIERELINPKIISMDDPYIYPSEGCLSIPHYWAKTKRYLEIEIESEGKRFVAERLEALVIQHELDHINGILTTDIELEKFGTQGRNSPCPCGSGAKYKKCCLR